MPNSGTGDVSQHGTIPAPDPALSGQHGTIPPYQTATLADYYKASLPVGQRVNEFLAALQQGSTDPNLWTHYLQPNEYADLNSFFQQGGVTPSTAGNAGSNQGGGTIPNSAASAIPGTPGAPTPTAQSIVDRINQQFPTFSQFLKVPDLANLMQQAADPANAWSPATFLSKLQDTGWWKATPAPARQWLVATTTDPAEAHRLLVQQTDQIRASAQKLGVPIDESTNMWIGLDALQNGWTADQITQHLVDKLMPATGGDVNALQGQAGNTSQQLKAFAQGNYLTPISDQALYNWTRGIMDGSQTQEGFQDYIKNQAKSLYPTFAPNIDGGTDVKTLVDPYAQVAAKTLEISPDAINFLDPKWNRLINSTDPASGQRVAMSLSDATTVMKTDDQYGYDKTQQATQEATSLANKLGKTFGVM